MNLFEAMEYGPIVACDEERGLLLTVNGSYFNLWVIHGEELVNHMAYPLSSRVKTENGLYGANMAEVMDAADALLKELIEQEGEGDHE